MKITRQLGRIHFVDINDTDGVDPKLSPTDLPLQIIHHQLLIRRVKPEPWCAESTSFQTRIRHLRQRICLSDQTKRIDTGQREANRYTEQNKRDLLLLFSSHD